MFPKVFCKDRITGAASVSHLLTAAAFYGRGIFTTIAVHDGLPFQWDLHWQRLGRDAEIVGLNISEYTGQQVRDAVEAVICENALTSGRTRASFLDTSAGGAGTGPVGRRAELVITAGEFRKLPQRLRLCLSPFPVNSSSPLAGVKSCNYLENLLAFKDARGRDCDEAVRLNERGYVTSACMANIFWTVGGRVFTPSLSTGCLRGTTRELVMKKIDVAEVEATPEALERAESVFLTSAGIGIAAVREFEGRELTLVPENILGLIEQNSGNVRP